MKLTFLKLVLSTTTAIYLGFWVEKACCAVTQSLNDTFFQNPAELSLINQMQLRAGNLFVVPSLQFTGTSIDGTGSATSKVTDNLPYLLGDYRVSERFVLGINIVPSAYGHLEWPLDSIVSSVTTTTNLLYYRAGFQTSYQVTKDLALGIGLNCQINKNNELNFVVPNLGNEFNKVSGLNPSGDIGLFYKINAKNFFTTAVYTWVNAMGSGTSSLNSAVSRSFRLGITEASVAYIGLQHVLSDKWFISEKIYWSGWAIQKRIHFQNTTRGSFVVPTYWKDVWSYQVATRYAATEKLALLGAFIYETNPNSTSTNNIGYPLASTMFISGGLDINLFKQFSTQLLYGYGMFVPKAKIFTAESLGVVSANTQAALLQFTYKT
ncbi:hypothetical protein TUM19329_08030 [Legionella antarctica]|uniref:Outer membrane protein n=1 Tax=Legionella antarctica TaxID=2708020 RepID=A0A6F8T345_9GAMM|nr:outer membrane protein transport protein [Legionella antarctica]BCA94442.1 hypothetical protein TUM19329_08030 [Legionella antarctica]